MESTPNLKIDGLDFFSIRENLKNYLESQSQFTDYNFNSSSLSFILDVLAYNTYYNSFYVNMAATEAFLTTAQRRNSVVNLARSLNYTPRSTSSARVYGTIKVTANDPANTAFINIPKYSQFQTIFNDETYTFLTSKNNIALKAANTEFIVENAELIEGKNVTEVYQYSNLNITQRFLINNVNADISTLIVRVFNSSVDSTERTFTRADNTIYVKPDSLVYYIEEVEDGKFEVSFGDNFLGKKLDDGNLVYLEYIVASSIPANQVSLFDPAYTSSEISEISFVPYTESYGGDARESIAKIKYNAPKSYTSQNRIVTPEDYSAIMLNQPNVDSAIVWGGEDNDPPQYGKVFIAVKPKNSKVLTQTEKSNLIKFTLNPKKIVTVTPEIVDPDYIYLLINANVKYDISKNIIASTSMYQLILNSILKYNADEISTFGRYFRMSKLTRYIDASERSILSSNVSVRLRKEVSIQLGINGRYEIDFANPINDITSSRPASHPYFSGNQISSNEFTFLGYPNCFLEENGGIVRIFRRFGAGFVGVVQNAGSVDYNTGKMILTDFGPTEFADGSNLLKITAIPKDIDILPLRSQIISIRESDVSINLIDDNSISLVNR